MTALGQRLKRAVFGLLGKDPEAVVVSFLTGDDERALAMVEEARRLIPDRRHYVVGVSLSREIPGARGVSLSPGSTWALYRQLRKRFRRLRIGMAPVLFTPDPAHAPLRRAAFLRAPGKILAYNARGERHHPRLRTPVASWLFQRGVPLDRIYLRPWWLCPWKRDRTTVPSDYKILDGRPCSAGRPRVAVLSPYFPYPLSHGGAVRIFNLLREAAREFDVFLFAFTEQEEPPDCGPVLEFCAKLILVPKPRYRDPRWSSLAPPEVCEYRSPVMRRLLAEFRREHGIELLQVEYTQLADYGGDILVEHDVTFDLYDQVRRRTPSLAAWWDWRRWRRFENKAVRRRRRVVVMSAKDARILAAANMEVIANGVDLGRLQPEPERDGQRLLFIGSFRHFPNVLACRFFVEEVWPRLAARFPEMRLTVVAGPDPLLHWRNYAASEAPLAGERIRLLGFVADVRSLYVEANVVIVPTLVSAGTNIKVLEAMAMERAVVSTPSGCAGLGLEHGASVWVAGDASAFAAGVARLVSEPELRGRIARAARLHAERRFDWRRMGERQGALWRRLLGAGVDIRAADRRDLD